MGRLIAWAIVAAGAAALAPGVAPTDPSLDAPAEALALGALCGAALFLALARRPFPVAEIAGVPRRRLLARSTVLTVKSAEEEAIWRSLLLGSLVQPLGGPGALAVSTSLFAAAHIPRQGRAAVSHLATGAVFGATYLATGRLTAAVAAHAGYNVLVGAAALTRPGVSILDTGAADPVLVASTATQPRPTPIPMAPAPPSVSPRADIRLEGVVKSFGSVRALDGVDLELRPGEVLALLGPNGAGKSTAVAILLGLRRPDEGRAWLAGRDPRDPRARAGVGAVLQDIGFPPTLRVREAVDLVRAHFPAACSTGKALERLGLASLAERQGAGLSGGQRRRLAVALALAGDPDVLFLDEPTAGMDATARRSLLRDLASFAADGGSVLLTTQQLAEAEGIATRVVVLGRGRVTVEGTVAEVRARAGTTRVTLHAERVPELAGIASVESYHDRHIVYVHDADAFVADLVRSGTEFSNLEVAPATLEDAFVALTGDEGS
jgi:ABC-2 type transport system ATP-binding protein